MKLQSRAVSTRFNFFVLFWTSLVSALEVNASPLAVQKDPAATKAGKEQSHYDAQEKIAFRQAEKIFLKAVIFHNRGRESEAEELYKESLLIDPNFTSSHINLANLLKKKGELPLAEQHYLIATQLSPKSFHAHFNLGELYLQQKRFDEAEVCFSRAEKLNPQDKGVLLNLSHVQLRYFSQTQNMANLGYARKYLQKVLKQDSRYAHAYYNLGIVSEHENKLGIALAYYREAVRFYPEHSEYKQYAEKRIARLNQVLR